MLTHISIIVFTSLLSSVLTLCGAWFLLDRFAKERIWPEVDAKAELIGEQIRQRVNEGVRDGVNDGFSDLQQRMTKTATSGGLDLLEEGLNQWFRSGRSKD
jgi:hypothetical protein